jgi:predicted permease
MNNGASATAKSGGIGFLGLLAIVFITLKLTGYINWSWWWVLAPIWIPWSIILGFVLVFLLIILFAKIVESRRPYIRKKKY